MSDHKYSFAINLTVWGNFYFCARISKEYFRRIHWTITWTFMVSRLERNANSSTRCLTLRKPWKQSGKKLFLGGASADDQLEQNCHRCNPTVDDCSSRKHRPMESLAINSEHFFENRFLENSSKLITKDGLVFKDSRIRVKGTVCQN